MATGLIPIPVAAGAAIGTAAKFVPSRVLVSRRRQKAAGAAARRSAVPPTDDQVLPRGDSAPATAAFRTTAEFGERLLRILHELFVRSFLDDFGVPAARLRDAAWNTFARGIETRKIELRQGVV